MFDSKKLMLLDILKAAHSGKLQLPDFQRDYVWNDADLRALLASVGAGYPVGALLTLGTGGEVRFKPRLIEGVKRANRMADDVAPDVLLLDGQQRITSLYQTLMSPEPVVTRSAKGKVIERYYYLDINRAVVNPDDLEEAIVALPADRIERSDFGREVRDVTTQEGEFAADLFPMNRSLDWTKWNFAWVGYWNQRGRDIWKLSESFFQGVINNFQRYALPVIELDKTNSRAAICTVFEKVNVGGKKLDAFELVTAIYAGDNFPLRDDWLGPPGRHTEGRHARMVGHPAPRDVLAPVTSVDFLKACSLMHTRAERASRASEGVTGQSLPQISCDRDAILALPLDAYRGAADGVMAGFIEAARFLNARNVIWRGDVPYPNQITALAAVFATLGHKATTAPAQDKLDRWFWSVALGEQYGSSPDTRLARDMPELIDWIGNDGPTPRALGEAVFQADRLRTLRIRNAAAYKALHALMMAQGCRDWITGKPTNVMTFFVDRMDIHHVFPRAWAERHGITPHVFNAIINKTPLSARSNQLIGGDAPSVYLRRIEAQHGLSAAQLDDLLRSHLIEPAHLRNDDFAAFYAARIEALSGLVARAMDKPVVRGPDEPGADDDADDEDEEVAAA